MTTSMSGEAQANQILSNGQSKLKSRLYIIIKKRGKIRKRKTERLTDIWNYQKAYESKSIKEKKNWQLLKQKKI